MSSNLTPSAIIIAIMLAGLAVMMNGYLTAPEGYEDKYGFRYGRPHASRRMAGVRVTARCPPPYAGASQPPYARASQKGRITRHAIDGLVRADREIVVKSPALGCDALFVDCLANETARLVKRE